GQGPQLGPGPREVLVHFTPQSERPLIQSGGRRRARREHREVPGEVLPRRHPRRIRIRPPAPKPSRNRHVTRSRRPPSPASSATRRRPATPPAGDSTWHRSGDSATFSSSQGSRKGERMAGQFEATIEIDRPVAEVFAFLADGENDPKFSPRVQRIAKTPPG